MGVLRSYHARMAHLGATRLLGEAKRRYEIPTSCNLMNITKDIKKGCAVCQACEPPNWEVRRQFHMTPVPDRIFEHVCIDIFSMPESELGGEKFDCMVLCVDRLSGWMLAKPTTKIGLTAEKAAKMLLDGAWDLWGVPSTITSDQGPQFAGK